MTQGDLMPMKTVRRRTVLGGAAALPLFSINGARGATRSIQVGTYTAQQGEYVRKKIIPPFEADYNCKVFTTEGVTLTQIAALRATRDNPKYSVMFMDDIGIERSMMLREAMRFGPHVLGVLKKKKLLEPMVRRSLERFYRSDKAAAILAG